MTEASIRAKKGMSSVKDMPLLQDGPPPGGFPGVRYARRIPNTGPHGYTVFAIAVAAVSYGFYQVGQGNKVRAAYKQEKLDARLAVVPFLQAEEDARFVRAKQRLDAQEAEIMKNVPGWEAGSSVYHTKRWMPPPKPLGIMNQ
jgi:NADH dehydrogenase (ubiquinone) 1 alpha subcomplex subunit 13